MRSILSQPKRLALFAYLATARPGGFHSRDALLGLFWPEADEEAARNRLRQALHQLRRSLGESVFASRADHEIGINPAALDCDALRFDEAILGDRLEEALGLYRGEFLQGFFVDDASGAERWIEEERDRRKRAAITAAIRLAEREESRREFRAGVLWARTAASLAPYDEKAARLLISLLNASGEPAAAQHAFDDFARRLREDLDLAPSAETVAAATASAGVSTSVSEPSGASEARASGEGKDLYLSLTTRPRSLAPAPASPRAHARVRARPHARFLAFALALALVAATGWFATHRPVATRASSPTIAVLPFVNLSRDSANEYFSDGVTEEILNSLASIRGLRVAARTSSFAYKNQSADVRSVGSTLGVANVLEGSVRRIGNRIKISAQLISVHDGMQVWAETYDREIDDIFAVQEEIARAITNALQIKLGSSDDATLERRSTSSPEAYDLYLRGKYLVSPWSEERNRKAVELFEQSISKDLRFALPYAGLARAYIVMGAFVPPRTVLPKAKAAALRALQLDSSLVETRLALADVRQVYDRDWRAAEREIQLALAISPHSAAAHAAYGNLLSDMGRFDEALVERQHAWEMRRAASPDTLVPAFRVEENMSWAGFYHQTGNTRRALEHNKAALALDPDNEAAQWFKVVLDHEHGDYASSLATVQRLGPASVGESTYLLHLGRAYAATGRMKDARAVMDTLNALARERYVPKDQVSLLYLSLRDTTKALDALEGAVEDYNWWLPNVNSHALFKGLHGHPRFRELMRRIGAP